MTAIQSLSEQQRKAMLADLNRFSAGQAAAGYTTRAYHAQYVMDVGRLSHSDLIKEWEFYCK